jgi:hypothetical protein
MYDEQVGNEHVIIVHNKSLLGTLLVVTLIALPRPQNRVQWAKFQLTFPTIVYSHY